MKESMFAKLVEVVHDYRSWVAVLDYKRTITLMARCGLELKPVRRRVLTLVATRPRGLYPKGHVWDIPEDKLDRAVRSLKQRDKKFADRWKHEKLTVEDAESLIRHATNGFLILNLNEDKL
jgi:hypothetical protein